jgi:hypothetical protein
MDELTRQGWLARDTHRLITESSEDFAHRMKRQLINERRAHLASQVREVALDGFGFAPSSNDMRRMAFLGLSVLVEATATPSAYVVR